MSCVKIGILLLYYRIFYVHQRFSIAVWVMGTVTVCWYLTTVFVACLQCYPANFMWDRTIPGGQCIPMSALYYGSSVSSLITDIAVFCLPMPVIWNMSVCKNQKIALSVIFLLGGLYVSVQSKPAYIILIRPFLQRLRDIHLPTCHHPRAFHPGRHLHQRPLRDMDFGRMLCRRHLGLPSYLQASLPQLLRPAHPPLSRITISQGPSWRLRIERRPLRPMAPCREREEDTGPGRIQAL